MALKICIQNPIHQRELSFYEHLGKILPSEYLGAGNIRKLVDSFQVTGPYGEHSVLVLQVSQMSLRTMNTIFRQGSGFDEQFVQGAIIELLKAVDFLHTKAQAVHTGEQGSFVLFSNHLRHMGWKY